MTERHPPRRLRLFLRDHRVLDASARIPEGQNLADYLGSRNRYVNLMDVEWLGTRAGVSHMVLKVDKVLWASSADDALPLTAVSADGATRRVEVELDGGYLLAAELLLSHEQRLSEYLQTAPPFVPLQDAELRPRGKALGDIAVNHDTVQAVREVRSWQPRSGAGDELEAPA